ncbi:transcriptional regulator [Fusarium sp. NRRL 25303]|nr:transcriptional regulator [Fusarium sp. NRRL 25303]
MDLTLGVAKKSGFISQTFGSENEFKIECHREITALDPTFERLHGCHVFSTEQDIEQHNETQPATGRPASTTNSQPGPSYETADRLIDSLMQVTAKWAEPPAENMDSDDFIDTDFQGMIGFGRTAAGSASGGSVSSLPSLLMSNPSTVSFDTNPTGQRRQSITQLTGPLADAVSRGPNRANHPIFNTGSRPGKEISGTNAPHGNKNDTDSAFTQTSPFSSSQYLTSLAPVSASESLVPDPLSTASPEVIFTRILLLMKQAGFEDMDSMVQAYYTAKFRYDSVVHWAQKRSREKRLGPLLTSLSRESTEWPVEQAAQYQDAILGIADGLCGMNVNAHATTPRSDESPSF